MKKMMLTWLTVASLLMGCSGSETSVKGTYRNPVIYADVPDMSVTRAGEYYYMISTTMHLMPGGPCYSRWRSALRIKFHRERITQR